MVWTDADVVHSTRTEPTCVPRHSNIHCPKATVLPNCASIYWQPAPSAVPGGRSAPDVVRRAASGPAWHSTEVSLQSHNPSSNNLRGSTDGRSSIFPQRKSPHRSRRPAGAARSGAARPVAARGDGMGAAAAWWDDSGQHLLIPAVVSVGTSTVPWAPRLVAVGQLQPIQPPPPPQAGRSKHRVR